MDGPENDKVRRETGDRHSLSAAVRKAGNPSKIVAAWLGLHKAPSWSMVYCYDPACRSMFRKSGTHFCDQNMLQLVQLRDFFRSTVPAERKAR
jgi:hypothetical protein